MQDPNPTVLIERASAHQPHTHDLASMFLAGYGSKETRLAYGRDLNQFFIFCADQGIDPLTARRPHIDLFMRWQEQRGLKNNTRGRRLAAIRSWYEWLVDEEILTANPARRVRSPRPDKPILPSLNRNEHHRFLAAAEELGGYDNATVTVMSLCCLRVSEATGANIADISTVDYIPQLLVHGKGDKTEPVMVPPKAMMALTRAWGDRREGPMLLNRWGKRMTRENVVGVIGRVEKAAGLNKGLTPHSMRRTAIQIALDSGIPARDVQHWARHASIDTTMGYDRRPPSLDRSPGWAVMAATA